MPPDMPPSRKSRACVPCHQRKVKCDATQTGTSCSRCMDKKRTELCVLVPLPGKRIGRRNSRPAQQAANIRTTGPTSNEKSNETFQHGSAQKSQTQLYETSSAWAEHSLTGQARSVGRSCRPSPGSGISFLQGSARTESCTVVEYYKDLNPIIILKEALGQPVRRGLVQVSTDHVYSSKQEQEKSLLDPIDQAYLRERHVHEFLRREVNHAFINLFFRHVYTYMPILNYARFMQDFHQNNCSSFLLYAVIVAVLPLASDDLVRATGFTDARVAQDEFFNRARILYDFGCEPCELTLLQGSLIMSWFLHALAPTKHSRYWFSNTNRLAIQMGLHRCEQIKSLLDPMTYKLYRRIWWTVQQRAVHFLLSGLDDSFFIIEEGKDCAPAGIDDFEEGTTANQAETTICQQCFLQSCTLAQIGAKFLRYTRKQEPPMGAAEMNILEHDIKLWRSYLPNELALSFTFTCDPSNTCVLVMHLFCHQIETLLYHTICLRIPQVLTNDHLLLKVIFEEASLIRIALKHGIVPFMPPFLIECIAQTMAIQMDIFQRSECSVGTKFNLKADLEIGLGYLAEATEKWPSAGVYSKAFTAAKSFSTFDMI